MYFFSAPETAEPIRRDPSSEKKSWGKSREGERQLLQGASTRGRQNNMWPAAHPAWRSGGREPAHTGAASRLRRPESQARSSNPDTKFRIAKDADIMCVAAETPHDLRESELGGGVGVLRGLQCDARRYQGPAY